MTELLSEENIKRRKELSIMLGERTGDDIHWTQVMEDKHCVYYHDWEYPDEVEVYFKPLPICAEAWTDIRYEDSVFFYQGTEIPQYLKDKTKVLIEEYREHERECYG